MVNKKEEIFKILEKYAYAEIYKIQVYDMIIQKVIDIFFFRINKEYKIQIQKSDFMLLKRLGIREVII